MRQLSAFLYHLRGSVALLVLSATIPLNSFSFRFLVDTSVLSFRQNYMQITETVAFLFLTCKLNCYKAGWNSLERHKSRKKEKL